MRFGTSLPIVQQTSRHARAWEASAGAPELIRIARAADELGFAWITCSDHVAIPSSYAESMGAIWYEPSATLAYLAAVTRRVRLLSHVIVLPYRHPLIVAKTYATLDALSGGRVILGVGSGHLKPAFDSLGVDHAARAKMSDEFLRALATAFEDEVSTFRGEFVQWRDLMVSPRAVQQPRPPFWVGGNTQAVARRAARYADGWIPWQLTTREFAERVRYARDQRESSGRQGRFSVVAPVPVGTDSTAHQIADSVHVWQRNGATDIHLGFANTGLDHLLERMEFFSTEVRPILS